MATQYVPTLNKRRKWHTSTEQELKAGDLVWIVEDSSPRGYSPLACVKTPNYGKDATARSELLKTATGDLTRPLVKLAPVLAPLGPEDGQD